jgi:hypothetical protein
MQAQRATIVVLVATVFIATMFAASANGEVQQRRYYIEPSPSSKVQYKPSPEGPGIPDGNYQLDFGLRGTFIYELDTAGPTARLLDLDLSLIGHDEVQYRPPAFGLVTADRVEAYLASHTFVRDFFGPSFLHFNRQPRICSS